ncbi:MAG: hypothetical protein WA474_01865 [Candidatus Sulfotelmatobacter sp.]
MAKADPPLALGEIIDRIEEMREELLILQRSLEKMELAEPAAPEGWSRKWDQGRR